MDFRAAQWTRPLVTNITADILSVTPSRESRRKQVYPRASWTFGDVRTDAIFDSAVLIFLFFFYFLLTSSTPAEDGITFLPWDSKVIDLKKNSPDRKKSEMAQRVREIRPSVSDFSIFITLCSLIYYWPFCTLTADVGIMRVRADHLLWTQ